MHRHNKPKSSGLFLSFILEASASDVTGLPSLQQDVRSLLFDLQEKVLESKEFYNRNPDRLLRSGATPKQLQVSELLQKI